MPDFPQAVAFYPGAQFIESCDATLAHGITPGIITLKLMPQDRDIDSIGDLVLQDGGTRIVFRDCKADAAGYEFGQDGQIVAVTLLDRRWRWAFGTISGRYNLRTEDGKLVKSKQKNQAAAGDAVTDTERTPKQLFRLCFDALGEAGVDLSDVPDDMRPTVEWDGERPARAIADLCDQLNCRVVLQLNDRVKICRAGIGARLPEAGAEEFSTAINPPDKPTEIGILTGREVWQYDLDLEPVGLDKDEKVKKVDDLSYKPAGGWNDIDIQNFNQISDKKLNELAKKSVARWYRPVLPFQLPGFGEIEDIQQIRIKPEQVEKETVLGVEKHKEAVVYGVWFNGNESLENTATKLTRIDAGELDKTVVSKGFEVDETRGLVKFGEPIYRLTGSGDSLSYDFAEIRLRCSIEVRDRKTGGWIRYKRIRRLDSDADTQTDFHKHDEIILTHIAKDGQAETTNKADVDRECDYYLDEIEREYRQEEPAEATYIGLLSINPDGAIQSVSWSTANGGTTRASRSNDPGTRNSLPYKIKRQNEKNKAAADFAAEWKRFSDEVRKRRGW